MLVPILLFALGLFLLIRGGDHFVDGATELAHRFHVPELLIGATVVSIGTTLPEVMVSTTSAIQGNSGFAYGNAIGSVICNTALIAALTIAVTPAAVERKSLRTPVCFFFIAATFYCVTAYMTGRFDRWVGIVLLCIFALYMTVTILQMRRAPVAESAGDETEEKETDKPMPLYKAILLLIVGGAFIAFGANLLVDNGTIIAQAMGVSDSVIGLTIVALGTSLPELVTAVTALIKKHGALSLGNVVGANLFNLVLVCGISTTVRPFAIPTTTMLAGLPMWKVVEVPAMFFVMAFLTVPALIRGKLSRYQGIVLLLIYAAFCTLQFVAGAA